jgi:hypothetical protein
MRSSNLRPPGVFVGSPQQNTEVQRLPNDAVFEEIATHVNKLETQFQNVSHQTGTLIKRGRDLADSHFQFGLALTLLGQEEVRTAPARGQASTSYQRGPTMLILDLDPPYLMLLYRDAKRNRQVFSGETPPCFDAIRSVASATRCGTWGTRRTSSRWCRGRRPRRRRSGSRSPSSSTAAS